METKIEANLEQGQIALSGIVGLLKCSSHFGRDGDSGRHLSWWEKSRGRRIYVRVSLTGCLLARAWGQTGVCCRSSNQTSKRQGR